MVGCQGVLLLVTKARGRKQASFAAHHASTLGSA